ncbi:hypothetical protein E2C01_004431 [Portunus trituberculatus]|uniref:Uncharacterized protein n=1 Tax=Portunus trituberculatus TaxID=210409 RepID=A0A5B7CU08_PORTR|nr:hypothetical protein [Portunus trituberculatus]
MMQSIKRHSFLGECYDMEVARNMTPSVKTGNGLRDPAKWSLFCAPYIQNTVSTAYRQLRYVILGAIFLQDIQIWTCQPTDVQCLSRTPLAAAADPITANTMKSRTGPGRHATPRKGAEADRRNTPPDPL